MPHGRAGYCPQVLLRLPKLWYVRALHYYNLAIYRAKDKEVKQGLNIQPSTIGLETPRLWYMLAWIS